MRIALVVVSCLSIAVLAAIVLSDGSRGRRAFEVLTAVLIVVAVAVLFQVVADAGHLVANRVTMIALPAVMLLLLTTAETKWPSLLRHPKSGVLLLTLAGAGFVDGYQLGQVVVGAIAAAAAVAAAVIVVTIIDDRVAEFQYVGWTLLLLSASLTVAALCGPRLLVTSGRWWTVASTSLLPGLGLLAVVAAVLLGVPAYQRLSRERSSDRVGTIAAAVGLAVATTALSNSVAVVPPAVGAVAGCRGVQVHSVPFLAETPDGGANARRGPSSISDQLQRLGSACAVGVLGYCRGEALYDLRFPVRDGRWYVLPHGLGLVSSTAVLDLSPLRNLHHIGCPAEVPSSSPSAPRVRQAGGVLDISVDDPGAANTGVAIFRPAFPPDAQYRQILLDTKPLDGVRVPYNFSGDVRLFPRTSRVLLAVTSCIAAGVPDGRAGFYSLQLPVAGKRLSSAPTRVPGRVAQLLQSACRYQAGEGIPVVPSSPPRDGL